MDPEPLKNDIEIYKQEQQRNAKYDSDIVQEIISQSKRFRNLKLTTLLEANGEPPKYGYLKKIAISCLEKTIAKQFAILAKIMQTNEGVEKAIQTEKLLHGIFSWKWSDFLERRKEENFVWVDILLRNTEDYLHYMKFQNDMKELQFLLNKIFSAFLLYIDNHNADICQGISDIIDNSRKTLHTLDNVEKEYRANADELQYTVYKEYVFTDAKRSSEERFRRGYLENRICNDHIIDPIEIRYQLTWFDNLLQQNQYKIDSSTNAYQTDIAYYKEKEQIEALVTGSCLDYCYSSIELYKNRIIVTQNKYDKDVDEIETKLTLLRMQIEKMKDQRTWLTSEIERFHEEEKNLRVEVDTSTNKRVERKQKKSIRT